MTPAEGEPAPERVRHSALGGHLAPARWLTYTAEAERTGVGADELYRWDGAISAALFEVIGHVECVVRQAIDRRLAEWNELQEQRLFAPGNLPSPHWALPDRAAAPLRGLVSRKVAESSRRARGGSVPTHDDVIAQMGFGTWVSLVPAAERADGNRNVWRLWDEAISEAFPFLGTRPPQALSARMYRLQSLRNRIAHHENLLAVDPDARLSDALSVLAAVNRNVADEVAALSRVRVEIRRDPRHGPGSVDDAGTRLRWLDGTADRFRVLTACVDNLAVDMPGITPAAVLDDGDLREYTRVDHSRGDFGVVVECDGLEVGVCWLQFRPPDRPGYGFVDPATPELGVSVLDGWRGRGFGRTLVESALREATRRGIRGVSLSVSENNPNARRLYHSIGFVLDERAHPPGTMVIDLPGRHTRPPAAPTNEGRSTP